MPQAEMKGKIPEVQNMEDILTSNVFGLLRYITHKDVLLEILGRARTLFGKSLLECIDFNLKKYTPEFVFWENIGIYGKPDLIIRFKKDKEPELVLCIEAKYYSPKSGEGDDDQLKRYFEGMTEFANLSKSSFLGIIYLTKYPSRKEVTESLSYIQRQGVVGAEDKFFQLKWSELTEAIEDYDMGLLRAGERMILQDLLSYLRHKNLIGFSKFMFQTAPFDIRPDHFYESYKFKGFTFLRTDFNTAINDKVH